MKQLRCIIVDDEPLAVKLLETYVNRHEALTLAGAYTSATKALEALKNDNIDIALLDIQMPQLSGLDLARAIADKPTDIIFVTAYRDYAIDGFRVHATDYLLKPVSYTDFAEAIDHAISQKTPDNDTLDDTAILTVRSDYRQIPIPLTDILYIEGLKDYIKIYTTDRQRPVITQMTMKTIESRLPEQTFMRIHRSYIINLRHITSYDRTVAHISGSSIPIGDTYRQRFTTRMTPS